MEKNAIFCYLYPMNPTPETDPKVLAKILAAPWVVIWLAALVTLMINSASSQIPFAHLLAWIMFVAAPCIAWMQLKG
jgi:hypothetical protein